jgi:hypothetical protein
MRSKASHSALDTTQGLRRIRSFTNVLIRSRKKLDYASDDGLCLYGFLLYWTEGSTGTMIK